MKARIYQPTKTAMQSGQANTRLWVIEFEPEVAKQIDSLTGWTVSGDMRSQIKLKFKSKEEAVAYATNNKVAYSLNEPKIRKHLPKAYADNFRSDKVM